MARLTARSIFASQMMKPRRLETGSEGANYDDPGTGDVEGRDKGYSVFRGIL